MPRGLVSKCTGPRLDSGARFVCARLGALGRRPLDGRMDVPNESRLTSVSLVTRCVRVWRMCQQPNLAIERRRGDRLGVHSRPER
jgi:hypothetical protein